MLSAGVPMWRLSAGGGSNLGLCCTEDGLCLGRTPLIERSAGGYVVRPRTDLDRLLKCSSAAADLEGLMRGLRVVKSALDENNLPLAQIAAVQLRIPDLPGFHARALLEGEDRLLKAECGNDLLARADWDPGQHPRAGTPPNPGWFAPSGGPSSEGCRAGRARRRRRARAGRDARPNGAAARDAVDARLYLLRRLEPGNPNLVYLAPPGPPSAEAVARLDAD